MEYVRRLVLVVLVLRVTQMLAPEGEMRSYVRFVCGVLLLLAIISPLVGLIPALEGGLDALSGDLSASPSGAGLALAERGRADTRQQAAELYGERLAGQVARELADLPAVRALQLGPEVHIRVQEDSGQIEEMTVRLHAVDRA
ncbi:MAG: stage III sporulation protein AF, partial [Bacillota bacterium]